MFILCLYCSILLSFWVWVKPPEEKQDYQFKYIIGLRTNTPAGHTSTNLCSL